MAQKLMETTNKKAHINKGLIIGAILIMCDVTIQLSHLQFSNWTIYLSSSLLAVGIIVAVLWHNYSLKGQILFSELFGYGFKVTAVAVCILFIYMLLALNLLFPNYVNQLFNQYVDALKQQHSDKVDAVIANKATFIKVQHIIIVSRTVMINLAIGIVGSLIGSMIKLVQDKMINRKIKESI